MYVTALHQLHFMVFMQTTSLVMTAGIDWGDRLANGAQLFL